MSGALLFRRSAVPASAPGNVREASAADCFLIALANANVHLTSRRDASEEVSVGALREDLPAGNLHAVAIGHPLARSLVAKDEDAPRAVETYALRLSRQSCQRGRQCDNAYH